MRHGVKGRKLGRTASHRAATLNLLATSLLKHKKIKTTEAKAKELRRFIDPIITRAKTDSVHSRRIIATKINDREVLSELFTNIIPKIGNRPGGYTRVVHLGQRKGDGAHMAIIELVDFSGVIKPKAPKKVKGDEKPTETAEEVKTEDKKEKKAKKVTAPKVKKERAPKEKITKEKITKTTKTPQKKGS